MTARFAALLIGVCAVATLSTRAALERTSVVAPAIAATAKASRKRMHYPTIAKDGHTRVKVALTALDEMRLSDDRKVARSADSLSDSVSAAAMRMLFPPPSCIPALEGPTRIRVEVTAKVVDNEAHVGNPKMPYVVEGAPVTQAELQRIKDRLSMPFSLPPERRGAPFPPGFDGHVLVDMTLRPSGQNCAESPT